MTRLLVDPSGFEDRVAALVQTSHDLVEELEAEITKVDAAYFALPDDARNAELRRYLANRARRLRDMIWQIKTAGQGDRSPQKGVA